MSSKRAKSDSLGERVKFFEDVESQRRLMSLVPALARLDGRSFHSFTKGLNRPYDIRLRDSMHATTKWLVEQTNARCGYTQSDEITLVWYEEELSSQLIFDGRFQKLTSTLASMASVYFNSHIRRTLPPEYWAKLPTFDCRCWSVPNIKEAASAVLWREVDAMRNAVTMAARCYYSHSELQNKSSKEMNEMLFQKGINFNDYPVFFKSGLFYQRRRVSRKFNADFDEDLPAKHAARSNPDLLIERQEVRELAIRRFSRVSNRPEVLFFGEDPVYAPAKVEE